MSTRWRHGSKSAPTAVTGGSSWKRANSFSNNDTGAINDRKVSKNVFVSGMSARAREHKKSTRATKHKQQAHKQTKKKQKKTRRKQNKKQNKKTQQKEEEEKNREEKITNVLHKQKKIIKKKKTKTKQKKNQNKKKKKKKLLKRRFPMS